MQQNVELPSPSQAHILPLTFNGKNADGTEEEKYNKISRYLADRKDEILHFIEVLDEVQIRQKVEKNPQQLCQLIEQQLTLERHISRLQEESDDIRWQVVSRQASLRFSDSAAQHLLYIQGQIGQALGALSALGAGLTFSLLFTASRGDLWCVYAAWWLFLIALCVTSALGLAGAGADERNARPSRAEWTSRRWSLLGIVIGALSVVGGFFALAIAVVAYDLTQELQTGHGVITGPRPGNWRQEPVQKVFAFVLIALFGSLWVAGFAWSLKPGLQLKNRKRRRDRRLSMLDLSRWPRLIQAKTLSEVLHEGTPK